MNRRSFLTRSGLALGALIVGDEVLEAVERLTHQRKVFPSASVVPRIWGDGIHDDTMAIQYAIDHAAKVGGEFVLPSGHYRVAGPTIVLRGNVHISNSYFDASDRAFPAPVFYVDPACAGGVRQNIIDTTPRGWLA